MNWDLLSWEAKRGVVLTDADHLCAYCGDAATEVDHVWPRAEGGSDDRHNLQALCRKCNASKGSTVPLMRLTPEQFESGVAGCAAMRDSLTAELNILETVLADMREHGHAVVADAVECIGIEGTQAQAS